MKVVVSRLSGTKEPMVFVLWWKTSLMGQMIVLSKEKDIDLQKMLFSAEHSLTLQVPPDDYQFR
jgi:hypothetical protein